MHFSVEGYVARYSAHFENSMALLNDAQQQQDSTAQIAKLTSAWEKARDSNMITMLFDPSLEKAWFQTDSLPDSTCV